MKDEYYFIPEIPKKCRPSLPKRYRHSVTAVIDIDERDGCIINGAVMSLAKGAAGLLAIAEGRHHVD